METYIRPNLPNMLALNKKKVNRSFIKFFVLSAVLFVICLGYLHWLIKDITIKVDGQIIKRYTMTDNVDQILKKTRIKINDQDIVTPGLSNPLKHGTVINIKRAVPVEIVLAGNSRNLKTAQSSVKAFLAKENIELASTDRIIPKDSTKITPNMKITIIRVNNSIEAKNVEIPYAVEKVVDNNIEVGFTKYIQSGEKGIEKQLIKITFEDGKETKRELISTEKIKASRNQIVAVGGLKVVSRGGNALNFKRTAIMTATGYSYTGHNTAVGITPHRGVVAVDPRVIPLGSRLYIENYGYATAADTGGAIKGNIIDLFFETNAEAQKWGRRSVKIYILE